MIHYLKGDIFESPAQVIVNTVNTVGVMGKGLALSFKQRYPEMFEKYKYYCEKKMFSIGKLILFYEVDHWILLFPTKENWRNPSKLEYIEKGLMKFVNTYAEKNITSIAFPQLGCGNGELDWNDVKILMEKYLKDLPIDVYIYLGVNPDVIAEHNEKEKTIKWLRENAKDMSFNGVKDDLYNISNIVPFQFNYNNKKYEFFFLEEKLNIIDIINNITYIVNEDELYSIWDYIRMNTIFDENINSTIQKIIYGMFYATGYLSKIKILNKEKNIMISGYQLNAGLGRIKGF